MAKVTLSLEQFIKIIYSFTQEAAPSKYDLQDEPEKAMQKHFAQYLSKGCDVLREVAVTEPAALNEAKKESWSIDESIQILKEAGALYILGELKLHTKSMVNRNFRDEVREDISRMNILAQQFADVERTFVLFVSCNTEEIDALYKEYSNCPGNVKYVTVNKLSEDGYYAFVAEINSNNATATKSYAPLWKERLLQVIDKGTQNEYYFPKQTKINVKI